MNNIKTKRINEEKLERANKIRTSLSRTRTKLFKADDEGKDTTLYTKHIKQLKQELAQLTNNWVTEFECETVKHSNGNYIFTARYLNNVFQDAIYKSDITETSKKWCCSELAGYYSTLKDVKEKLEENTKYMWQNVLQVS